MQETLDIPDQTTQLDSPKDPPSKQLWQKLYDSKAYTNSYDEFQKKYSKPEDIDVLHQKLSDAQAYTNSKEDFYTKYFPASKKKETSYTGLSNGSEVFGFDKFAQKTDTPPSQNLTPDNNFGMPTGRQVAKGQQVTTDETSNPNYQQNEKNLDFQLHHEERAKAKQQKIDAALDNTTEKYFKLKGINAPKGSALFNQQKTITKKLVDDGNAFVTKDKYGNPGLQRVTGFWENLKNGWNESEEASKQAKEFTNNMTDQQRVDYINANPDKVKPVDAFIGERPSGLGSFGHFTGSAGPFMGRALAGAAIGTAAIAGAPESMGASLAGLPLAASFLITTPDMVNQAVQQKLIENYQILKRQNPNTPEADLMKEAREKGAIPAMVGAIVTNAAMMGTGLKTPLSLESRNLLTQYAYHTANSGLHMGIIGSAVTAGEKLVDEAQGIHTTTAEKLKSIGDSFGENLTTGAVFSGLMQAPRYVPKMFKSVLKYALIKNENPKTIQGTLQANENLGIIPPGTTVKTMADLTSYKSALDKTVDGLSPESEASVAGLIQVKDKLVEESKTKDDSFKDDYKQKIDAIDNQIKNIQRTGKPFEHEIDEVSGEPYVKPTFDKEAEKKVEDIVQDISKGKPIEDAENLQIEQNFPDEIKKGLDEVVKEEKLSQAGKEEPKTDVQDNVKEYLGSPVSHETPTDVGAGDKDAKIASAVIEINGKMYEGKNHAEAILKAKADGQDISNVDRKGEGKFKLSDGTIIDRAEAKKRFGADRSEQLIPQDEAAKQADKEYQKENINLQNEVSKQIPSGNIGESGQVSTRAKALHFIRENLKSGVGNIEGNEVQQRHQREDTERKSALEFAKKNNLWVDDLYSLGDPLSYGGNENTLAVDKEKGYMYKSNNLFNSKNSITQLLEQTGWHNEIFPHDRYDVIGFTGHENGDNQAPYVEPILRQKLIDDPINASDTEIHEYMTNLGFKKVGDFKYSNGEYEVGDLRPRNVLKDTDGNIHVIDDIVTKNENPKESTQPSTPTEVKDNNEPMLSEKEFDKKYKGQHKDLRAVNEDEANEKFKTIKEQGFKEGVGPNALPVQRYDDTSITGKKYGNKKGDYVYLIPKEFLKDTPNGLKVKEGFKPTENERVKIEYDGQPTYEAYKNQHEKNSKENTAQNKEVGGEAAKQDGKATVKQKKDGVMSKAQGIEDLTDPVDVVLQYFAGGGKIHPDVLKKMFGGGNDKINLVNKVEGEKRSRIGLLSKTGKTISQLAHELWEGQQEQFLDVHTTQDFENAIERVILDHKSAGSMAKHLIEKYITRSAEEHLSEEENKLVSDQMKTDTIKYLDGVPEGQAEELIKIITRYQDQYGFVNWEKLAEDTNGFDPEILSLTSETIQSLDGIIAKNTKPAEGELSNTSNESNGSKNKEAEVKQAQSDYDSATTALKSAEDKLAKEQAKQADMFAGGQQKGMFVPDAGEAKSILDPLKQKVKETKAALDKANIDLENANKEGQPKLFEEPITLNKSEERIAGEIPKATADKIVEAKNITLENIDTPEIKKLFEGYPYTPEDYKKVKTYLNERGQSITEPSTAGQPGIGDAENKGLGDKSTEVPPAEVKITASAGENATGDIQPKSPTEGEKVLPAEIEKIAYARNNSFVSYKQLHPDETVEDYQKVRGTNIDIPTKEINELSKKYESEQKKKSFDDKVDDIAKKVIEALTPKTTKGVKKQGGSIEDVVKKAAELIKKTYHFGKDIHDAIDKAIQYIKDNWKSEWGDFDKDMEDTARGILASDLPKTKEDLKNDIRSGRSNGLDDEEIKKLILKEGITKDDADDLIETVNRESLTDAEKRQKTKEDLKSISKEAPVAEAKTLSQKVGDAVSSGILVRPFKRLINAFHPFLFDKTKDLRRAYVDIRKKNAELDQALANLESGLKEQRTFWMKIPRVERHSFILSMENPELHGKVDPKFEKFSQNYRDMFDKAFDLIKEHKDIDALQDYFAHFWKDPVKADKVLRQINGNKPLEGNKSFLKKRFYSDILQGMKAGLELATDNPAEIVHLAVRNAMRFNYAQNILGKMKETGVIKHFEDKKEAPEGWLKITNDNLFTPNPKDKLSASGFYALEQVAIGINNFTGKGIFNRGDMLGSLGKTIRWYNNIKNLFQLGFSPFHALTTGIETSVNGLQQGIQNITTGRPKLIGQGIIKAIESTAFAPLRWGRMVVKGNKIMNDYAKGVMTTDVKNLIEAGGRTKLTRMYTLDAHYNLQRSFYAMKTDGDINIRNMWGVLSNAVGVVPELIGKPLMNYWVSALKVAGHAEALKNELMRRPDMNELDYAKTTQRLWDDLDDSLGQVVYDNLFWDKAVKDLGFMSVRSLGWSGGTIKKIGKGVGGAFESLIEVRNTEQGMQASRGRLLKGEGLNARTAWLVSLPLTVGFFGGMYQYAATGNPPDELKDYFFPKDGTLNPDGTEHRIDLPSYMKDIAGYLTDPLKTMGNKLAPGFHEAKELLNNKDFYSTQIFNPDDPIYLKGLDILKYEGQTMIPFSMRTKTGEEPPTQQKVQQFFGLMSAPKSEGRTDLENKISLKSAQNYSKEAMTKETRAMIDARTAIKDQLHSGKKWNEIDGDLKEMANYNQDKIDKVIEDAKISNPYFLKFGKLTSKQQLEVWKDMSDDEKKDYAPYIHGDAAFDNIGYSNPGILETYPEYKGYIEEMKKLRDKYRD